MPNHSTMLLYFQTYWRRRRRLGLDKEEERRMK
jgi:hypothetical protein